MSLPLRVCGSRVLIQADQDTQAVEQTDGGILIAKTLAAAVDGEDAHESWYQGTVVALGDEHPAFDVRPFVLRRLDELREVVFKHGCPISNGQLATDAVDRLRSEIEELPTERERDFNVGDRVIFSHTAGEEVDINGQRYLILKESDILGVLNA